MIYDRNGALHDIRAVFPAADSDWFGHVAPLGVNYTLINTPARGANKGGSLLASRAGKLVFVADQSSPYLSLLGREVMHAVTLRAICSRNFCLNRITVLSLAWSGLASLGYE
jgi:hypothetical protein